MKRILLVEDEDLLLLSLGVALRQLGCEVLGVARGADALTAMNSVQYDVCLLDVQLPDMNGLEMLKTIREISPATKIVVMTALELTERQMADIHANSCQFLPKPFGLQTIRSVVLGMGGTEASV